MSDDDLILEMRRRVRRHMLTSIGGIVLGIVVIGLTGGAVRAAGLGPPFMALSVLGLIIIPAVGFWSTFENLRCPACGHRVIVETSWNYSLFSRWAPKYCPGCSRQLFSADDGRRFMRTMIIVAGVAFMLALLGGIGGYAAQRAKTRPQNAPAQQR